jgi:hypothetical protein
MSAHWAIPQSHSCPLIFDGPKTSGYLALVRLQSGAQAAPVAQLVEQFPASSLAHLYFHRGACRDDSNTTLNHGGHMAHKHEWEESNFEITSKRRKGFPSETQVKRGVRIVHGEKQLNEKLGRNAPCPCGSARSF